MSILLGKFQGDGAANAAAQQHKWPGPGLGDVVYMVSIIGQGLQRWINWLASKPWQGDGLEVEGRGQKRPYLFKTVCPAAVPRESENSDQVIRCLSV